MSAALPTCHSFPFPKKYIEKETVRLPAGHSKQAEALVVPFWSVHLDRSRAEEITQ